LYAVVWAIICIVWRAFKGERFGVTGLPYYIIYRTARLNKWIQKIADFKPNAWRTIWDIGVVTGLGLMIFAFDFLGKNLALLLVKPQQAGPIQPIIPIPGVGISFQTFPYVAFALSILLISHELSHGIACLADHIPLKSTGLFYLHVIVGGFVEPVEEKLNEAPPASRLRVFAAGSYTNIVLGILFLFLLANFSATTALFYTPGGVSITALSPGLPAASSGLRVGDTVTSINGTKIANVTDLQSYMRGVVPGQRISVGTERGSFLIKTAVDPTNSSHALIGVEINAAYKPKFPFLSPSYPQETFETLFWSANIFVSVAFINMLPLPPFDGAHYLDVVLSLLRLKRVKEVRLAFYGLSLALLLLNLMLSWFRFGFVRL
jgi:membrane-associated protease RseP (regulator of RpoE activity)